MYMYALSLIDCFTSQSTAMLMSGRCNYFIGLLHNIQTVLTNNQPIKQLYVNLCMDECCDFNLFHGQTQTDILSGFTSDQVVG